MSGVRKGFSALAGRLSMRGMKNTDKSGAPTPRTSLGEDGTPEPLQIRKAGNISELYEVGKELGSGGFSVVKVGKDKSDGTKWALKLIKTAVFKKNQKQTELEVEILSHVSHHGVVHIREVVVTNKYYVIVLELCVGGELFDRIVAREKYSEEDARGVSRHLLETMQFLHKRNVAHRDLKPENLLFDSEAEEAVLKLTDFGFANFVPPEGLRDSCGTPEYVAPEIIDEQKYDTQVDMWSTGVIIYILLCGFPPFFGESDDELFEKIRTCDFHFLRPYWDPVSDEAKDLIRKLLNVNPKKRLTATQALAHPWFSKGHVGAGDLTSALDELARYNSTKKFRKAVNVVIATNKLKRMRQMMQK